MFVPVERDGKCKIGTHGGITVSSLRAYMHNKKNAVGKGPLELYGVIPEGKPRENDFFRHLRDIRTEDGEWFYFNDETEPRIRDYILKHHGVLGWPTTDLMAAPAADDDPDADGEAEAVQLVLGGVIPSIRVRPKSELLRQALDNRPILDTAQTGIISYYTPEKYVDAARRVLGKIDLDPASCAEANETVRAETFYGPEEDGLRQDWSGTVFLNPPWSGGARPFVNVLFQAYKARRVKAAILVLNSAYSDRKYMRKILRRFPVCFTNHRVRYGGSGRQGTGGTMFIYFGPKVQRFVNTFSAFGPVFTRLLTDDELREREQRSARNGAAQ